MPDPIIEVTGLTFTYPRAQVPALAGVSFQLPPGQSLGIVGESGSGKTTLGRLLIGALTPTAGVVSVGGRTWSSVRRRDPLRRRVQMVFQDPYSALNPMLTAVGAVSEACQVAGGMAKAAASRRAEELLAEVGLTGPVCGRRARQLSGGQCQRVGIARALASNPAVLVADEPTSSLDVSVQAQILNLLNDLREKYELTLVLISHDLTVVGYMTENAMVMYHGRVVETGQTALLLSEPAHPYTRALLDSVPNSGREPQLCRNDVTPDLGCSFASRCPRLASDCAQAEPSMVGSGAGAAACFHPLRPPDRAGRKQRTFGSQGHAVSRARIAVIGCGSWAVEAHLPALASDPRVELVGLADKVAANLTYAAQRFTVERTFRDAGRLLEATQPDGVVVATPPSSHAEVGMLVLAAGAHLLVEKPMVITVESGRALIAAAGKADREIIVGHPWHYSPQALALRALLERGVIGEIQAVGCVFGSSVLNYYRGDTESDRRVEGYGIAARPETYSHPGVSGGGQGQAQLSHAVALLLFLTGLRPMRVSAFTRSLGLDVDVIDAVSTAFEGGAVGTFITTGAVPPGLPRPAEYRLFGRSGYVAWDFRSGQATVVTEQGEPERLASLDPYSCYPRYAPANNLVEVVLGLAPNGSPPDIGLQTAAFLAAMYGSAAQNGASCQVEA